MTKQDDANPRTQTAAPNPLVSGVHSRGALPHLKREGASYFVTFRLEGTLPREVLARLKQEREAIIRQALVQIPLNSKNDFKPGKGMNLTAGLRYVTGGAVVPQLQINARVEGKESGANADVPNSGATLIYLSPGATVTLTEHLKAYGFLQAPIHQHVNGLQLEPKYSVSVGLHYAY